MHSLLFYHVMTFFILSGTFYILNTLLEALSGLLGLQSSACFASFTNFFFGEFQHCTVHAYHIYNLNASFVCQNLSWSRYFNWIWQLNYHKTLENGLILSHILRYLPPLLFMPFLFSGPKQQGSFSHQKQWRSENIVIVAQCDRWMYWQQWY